MEVALTDSPALADLLTNAALSVLLYGVLVSAAATLAVRRRGGRWAVRVWAMAVALFAVGITVSVHSAFDGGIGSPLLTLYMGATFIGIPSGLALYRVRRLHDRLPPSGAARQFVNGFVFFLIGLPPAIVLGALPDAARMFF